MRYVLFAFLMAGAVMVWANTSERGKSVKRHLSEHPTDPRWSH